jgi:hypothetical protein
MRVNQPTAQSAFSGVATLLVIACICLLLALSGELLLVPRLHIETVSEAVDVGPTWNRVNSRALYTARGWTDVVLQFDSSDGQSPAASSNDIEARLILPNSSSVILGDPIAFCNSECSTVVLTAQVMQWQRPARFPSLELRSAKRHTVRVFWRSYEPQDFKTGLAVPDTQCRARSDKRFDRQPSSRGRS